MPTVPSLDDFDLAIVRVLAVDGRVPFRELARRVGLSTPAVTDRVRKLRARGTITAIRAAIDPRHLGVTMEVSIALDVVGARLQEVADKVARFPEVVRCRRLTGDACYLIDAAITSTEHLKALIDQLAQLGTTSTSLVISTPVAERLPFATAARGDARARRRRSPSRSRSARPTGTRG
jgi:Lrp/AsnC family leucine-responsive transcriptional regulator